jgi:lipoprotein-anchoring transpeptidase ErfK/SrfK
MNRPAHQITLKTQKTPFAYLALLFAAFTLCTNATAQSSLATQAKSPTHSARLIIVSFADRKLALLEGDRVIKVYDVAVGAPVSPSPSGDFQIVQRLENPTYYKPGVVIGPGVQNPLGPRWIGLNVKGFGIHGTNRPDSIGKNASLGCIRLRNQDIKDLFARVQVGDHVSLVAERTDETARLFGPAPSLAEAHESLQANNEPTGAPEAHGDR